MASVLAIVALLAACTSESRASHSGPTAKPIRTLAAALTDHGLTFSPSRIAAASYRISFTDRRAHPTAGEKIELAIGPQSGFAPDTVPLGSTRDLVVWGNEVPWLVIDGVTCLRPQPRPRDCDLGNGVGGPGLAIDTSPEYPTPAT